MLSFERCDHCLVVEICKRAQFVKCAARFLAKVSVWVTLEVGGWVYLVYAETDAETLDVNVDEDTIAGV